LSFGVHELLDTRMTKAQDRPHGGSSVDKQLRNNNTGFAQTYMDERGGPTQVHPVDVMGYHFRPPHLGATFIQRAAAGKLGAPPVHNRARKPPFANPPHAASDVVRTQSPGLAGPAHRGIPFPGDRLDELLQVELPTPGLIFEGH
jgi:hypothetical protein